MMSKWPKGTASVLVKRASGALTTQLGGLWSKLGTIAWCVDMHEHESEERGRGMRLYL